MAAQKDSLNHNLRYARLRDFCGYDTIFFNNLQYRIHQVITQFAHVCHILMWCHMNDFFCDSHKKKSIIKIYSFPALETFFFSYYKKN